MKTFTKNNVTYSVRQHLCNGIQYEASYKDGLSAWAFLPGRRHTRAQVVGAVNEVNARAAETREELGHWED